MKSKHSPLRKLFSAVKRQEEKNFVSNAANDGSSAPGSKVCTGGVSGSISKDINDNLNKINQAFHCSEDLKSRVFEFGGEKKKIKAALVFIDGLTDSKIINDAVVEPLLYGTAAAARDWQFNDSDIDAIKDTMVAVGDIGDAKNMEDAVFACLMGDCVMFVGGFDNAIIISAKGYETRSIQPSDTEVSVRGPKDSFVENLRTNTGLIRRRIKNTNLCFESLIVGKQSKTPISVVYMQNIADKELVSEVKRRIKKINIDAVLGSGYVEQLICDEPLSIFSTVGYTERPDVLCAKILEGRVGIVVDGSPHVLTVPYFFIEAFQTAEDYYNNFSSSSILRLLRYAAFFLTILAPAIYVALSTYHQELIPTSLLLTMSAAKEGIPFSAFFEALVMMVVFEILKEAGIRLPQPIGQTISIVGALVMGEAAVSAGFVSAPLVIVIAFTAVSGFVVSFLSSQILLLRFIFLLLAGLLGGYGIALGVLVMLIRIADMESFGYKYMSPFVPFNLIDQKDNFIRLPLWLMRTRPLALARKNRIRENTPVPPGSDGGEE